MAWHAQKLNSGGVTNGPGMMSGIGHELAVSVYNSQQHFVYLDANRNLQDAWYDGSAWHLQQINNANGRGATVAGEFIACPGATAPALGNLCVTTYQNQQHFSYLDYHNNIQDVFWDGSSWHMQQINNANGHGATVGGAGIVQPGATAAAIGDLCVCSYHDQQHFVYRDANRNVQDVWWDGGSWHTQQINNANGHGSTIAGEYVACESATAPMMGDSLQVCVYYDQQHFSYGDSRGNIQDVFWDGSSAWHLQQINNANAQGPTVAGEGVCCSTAHAPVPSGTLAVTWFGNQQHFTYRDAQQNIQDIYWDQSAWHAQQLTNAGGHGASVAGMAVMCPQATAVCVAGPVVGAWENQQHFVYVDPDGRLQDVWWNGDHGIWQLQQLNTEPPAVGGEYIAVSSAPAAFVFNQAISSYGPQQHFVYLATGQGQAAGSDVWDCFWVTDPPTGNGGGGWDSDLGDLQDDDDDN